MGVLRWGAEHLTHNGTEDGGEGTDALTKLHEAMNESGGRRDRIGNGG